MLADLQGALERDTDEPYFLGSIVLVKNASASKSEVIDGQQRLTTLTLLIAVLRDLVDVETLKADIHKFIEEPAVEWDDQPARARLELRQRDAQFFKDHVQQPGSIPGLIEISDNLTSTDSQKALRDNAKALHEVLQSWSQDDLQALYKMMAKRTFMVIVSTPDLNSAYRIFSVMNARGLPLSPPDIFKARVIGAIPEGERAYYADLWESLEQELSRDEFSDLFLHIRAVESQTRAIRGLLLEFPEQVLNRYLPSNGKGFIKEILEPYAAADSRLLSQDFGGSPDWLAVNAWLKRLAQLDNDDWRPAALWALKTHRDDARFLNVFLRRLERLAASMLLRREYRTPRVQRYMELLKQLAAGDGLEADAFVLREDEKAETLRRLDAEIYLVQPVRKYVLLLVDSILADDPGATYEHATISVEHVLPRNPAADSQWTLDFDDEQRTYWTHRLGNLLLLNRRKNSQANNFEFSRKKETYFTSRGGVSVFALTTQVLNESAWTPSVIERRHGQLLALLRTHWELD